jgi:glycosyltransferase involved in cell wall biosynthesis
VTTTAGQVAKGRVLFVSPETNWSGPIRQLLQLVPILNRKGWKTAFAAPADANLSALCRECDVVVANTLASWPAIEAARRENVPAIWYIHEAAIPPQSVRMRQISDALNVARLIVVPSPQTARLFKGASVNTIETVPYGVSDPGDGSVVNESKSISFVALGGFEPGNGQNVLIDAISRLDSETRRRVSFKIAGPIQDRQFFNAVRKRAARLKNVELIDSPNLEEAIGLLADSDGLISLSREESVPTTIIEAASFGKAIISTDLGGLGEWFDNGWNALLVPGGDPAALTAAIARLEQDRHLLHRLGATARRTYKRHFTLERFADRFAKVLEGAMESPAQTPDSPQQKYERWIAAFDNGSAANRVDLARKVRRLHRHPLMSILLPVYNPELKLLEAAIDSVRNQIYPHWELCIAEDASTNAGVRPFLEEAARGDPRIKVTFRQSNGHISACSNSALSLASGEWCALLDQDDALSESALAFVAMEVAEYPGAGLIYSDEDKIDNHGARSTPYFKTDWNPELFLAQNYINHLGVYRTPLIRETGGFREGYEGSQDYDLALRCTEKLRPEQVRHIPRILYHWRMTEGSVATVAGAKPYATQAARRAIADHLARAGIAAQVVPCPENTEAHRVIYEITKPEPLVSILIPMRDRVELLKQCIRSLRGRTDYSPTEIIIIDNDSVEKETHRYLAELVQNNIARVVAEPGRFNFSRLVNRGAEEATGEILALLNNDIEAEEPDWLREMVSHVLQPKVGAVGARLWYPNGRLQHAGVIVGLGGVAGQVVFDLMPRGQTGYFDRGALQQNYCAVTAACMLVRKKAFEDLGGFDERNLAVSFNDVDFCLRLLERRWRVVWTPYANLTHRESASRGRERTKTQQAQFFREATYMQETWGVRLQCDPFYNPNLSLNMPGFDFAFPPRWESCANAMSIAA